MLRIAFLFERRRPKAAYAFSPHAGRRRTRKLRSRVVHHRKLGCAQALEFVAQAGGFLEVEIGGGGAHARFQVGDHRLEIVADGGGVRELAALAGAGGDEHVVALVDAVEDVADALADAFGRNAVGLLKAACFSRRRLVSAMARSMEPVTWSA